MTTFLDATQERGLIVVRRGEEDQRVRWRPRHGFRDASTQLTGGVASIALVGLNDH